MKKSCKWALIAVLIFLLLVELLSVIEAHQDDTQIHNFSEALWYSLITVSTVGYGDMTPVSLPGRIIGLVFVLCSVGLLSALISLGLRFLDSTLIPHFRLRLNRGCAWYVFQENNADAHTLATALLRQDPGCILIFPNGEKKHAAAENTVFLSSGIVALIQLRGGTQGMTYFAMSSDPWENYAAAAAAGEKGVMSYCMGDIRSEALPENVHLFSLAEAVSRRYWDTHPLSEGERCIVLIGGGKYAVALLERALLNNVFIAKSSIEYHAFGTAAVFSDLHPEIVKALGGSSTGDKLFLHEEAWTSARDLLLKADRIIFCSDRDSENLTAYDTFTSLYTSRAALHIRLNTPLKDFDCFGQRDEILTPEYVIKDELNRRAVLMNDIYNELSPNPVPWQKLSSFLQQSNIAAADHLLVKARYLLQEESLSTLSTADCERAYRRYLELYPTQRDQLLEMEHRRWMRFYQMYNWQYAPVRDNTLRHHPLLLPYAQLSREDQEKDAYAWEMLGRLAQRQ